MKKTEALAMMAKYPRFSGDRSKWLPLAMLDGIVGITATGNGTTAPVRLFSSMPVAFDPHSTWCKAFNDAADAAPGWSDIALYSMRTVETFIPMKFTGGLIHDRIISQKRRGAFLATASVSARETLEFALAGLGCSPPLLYNCVDPETFELGFEAHIDDYAMLKLASPITNKRVAELVVDANASAPFADWAAQRHATAQATAASSQSFRRDVEERMRRESKVAA